MGNRDKVKILFEKLVRGVLAEYLENRGDLGSDTRQIMSNEVLFEELFNEFFPRYFPDEMEGGGRRSHDHSIRDHRNMLLESNTLRSPEVIKQIEKSYDDNKKNINDLYE